MYLLSLIFNIYVVLYSALFPFVYTLFTWLFLFCCAYLSFLIIFTSTDPKKKKKKPNRELTQLSPIPDLGVFTRIGEERKDEEWGGELPFPYLDVLREREFEGIS